MILTAILLIIIIVIITAYLITIEAKSYKAERNYGKIIGPALFTILVIVIFVWYMFMKFF